MTNSNRSFFSHSFRNIATYSFKLSTKNCGQTAADGNMVTIDSLQETTSAISDGIIADRTAYHLAIIPHDWHTTVRYDSLKSFKVIDFYVT